MPVCSATVIKTGLPCTKAAKTGGVCGIHAPRPPKPEIPDAERCVYIIRGKAGAGSIITRRCDHRKNAESQHDECTIHRRQRTLAVQREAFHRRRIVVHQHFGLELWAFWAEMRRDNITVNIQQVVRRAVVLAGDTAPTLAIVWAVMEEIRQAHQLAPVTELQRIVNDPQSIHTRHVTEQHQKNLAIILATPVPENQLTMDSIKWTWAKMFKTIDQRIYVDMQKWYDTESCRTPSDWMYRKTLDHLIARIRLIENKETRRELMKRLQQECAESYNMCCDGHINRLTNVMVGFDEAFKQDVPKGLILQTKMAEIAKIQDVEERFKAATALMTELNIGNDEAGPWLDAISE